MRLPDGTRLFMYRRYVVEMRVTKNILDVAVYTPDKKDMQKFWVSYRPGKLNPVYVARRIKRTAASLDRIQNRRREKQAIRRIAS